MAASIAVAPQVALLRSPAMPKIVIKKIIKRALAIT